MLMRAIANEQLDGFPKHDELKSVFVEPVWRRFPRTIRKDLQAACLQVSSTFTPLNSIGACTHCGCA